MLLHAGDQRWIACSLSARAPSSKWRWQAGPIASATMGPAAWVHALDTGRSEGPS